MILQPFSENEKRKCVEQLLHGLVVNTIPPPPVRVVVNVAREAAWAQLRLLCPSRSLFSTSTITMEYSVFTAYCCMKYFVYIDRGGCQVFSSTVSNHLLKWLSEPESCMIMNDIPADEVENLKGFAVFLMLVSYDMDEKKFTPELAAHLAQLLKVDLYNKMCRYDVIKLASDLNGRLTTPDDGLRSPSDAGKCYIRGYPKKLLRCCGSGKIPEDLPNGASPNSQLRYKRVAVWYHEVVLGKKDFL